MAIPNSMMLAMSMHAQPGVYAVLLGSGASAGAGVMTGWEVVQDLVRKVAALSDDPDGASLELAQEDPVRWWEVHGEGELGYSSLLAQLAGTAPARQGLLSAYFEPRRGDEGDAPGPTGPSRAHRAIADLVVRGSVRVIVTTNFDRLMEDALVAVGIAPRVVSTVEQVRGMTPLVHAPVTVIKVHGDYLDAETLNTPQELDEYPEEWRALLRQVFDDYGLVVSGWSAAWDKALVRALEGASHRYQLFWDSRSSRGAAAQQLRATRAGSIIESVDADELFERLLADVEALDKLAEPRMSTDVAVTKLKRYLPDPARRIDLHDLVMAAADDLAAWVRDQEASGGESPTAASCEQLFDETLAASQRLLHLCVTGAWHDRGGMHDDLWVDVLQRLVDAADATMSGYSVLIDAKSWSASFLLTAMAVVAAARGRESLFLKLGTEVEGRTSSGSIQSVIAAQRLHTARIYEDGVVGLFPRWGGRPPRHVESRLLKTELRSVFEPLIPSETAYTAAFRGAEYRIGLLQSTVTDIGSNYPAASGEFIGREGWTYESPRQLVAGIAFRKDATRRADWPWTQRLGGPDNWQSYLVSYEEGLSKRNERW